jgi:hypothetical protein
MTQKTPPASSTASEINSWLEWAKADLWSHAELTEICTGRVPGTPNRTQAEQLAINAADEKIARGTLSGALKFVARDDADSAARMYGTHRHYMPAVAAEWAAKQFDNFPQELLEAVRSTKNSSKNAGWPWGEHSTKNLQALAAAAHRFWKNYDPTQADTSTTNKEVARWLAEEQKVSPTLAEAMATILRADGLPTGPKKKS